VDSAEKPFNIILIDRHNSWRWKKQMDLPLLMAVEFSKEWASTKHRYIYTHHYTTRLAKIMQVRLKV
jgi:hypothetical protein